MHITAGMPAALETGRASTGLLPDWAAPAFILTQPGLAPWLIIGSIVFAESGLLVGFFLPGDSLLFTAGLLVATGTLKVHILLLGALVFVCAFAGDQTGYLIGRKAGPAIFKKPDAKMFKQERLTQAHAFFEKYGGRAVILARFVPVIRTFTPVIAGAASMSYRTFLIYNATGALLWGIGVTLLGLLARALRLDREEHRRHPHRSRTCIAAANGHRAAQGTAQTDRGSGHPCNGLTVLLLARSNEYLPAPRFRTTSMSRTTKKGPP